MWKSLHLCIRNRYYLGTGLPTGLYLQTSETFWSRSKLITGAICVQYLSSMFCFISWPVRLFVTVVLMFMTRHKLYKHLGNSSKRWKITLMRRTFLVFELWGKITNVKCSHQIMFYQRLKEPRREFDGI